MHSHPLKRRHNRRADEDTLLLNTPTAVGLTNAVTAQDSQATANTLVFNTSGGGSNTAGEVQLSTVPTGTLSNPPTESQTDSVDPATNAKAQSGSGKSNDISIGTVIGACLGALAGAIILILIGLWMYKRGTKPRSRRPSNARGMVDKERAWAKMDDDEDKWDGKDGKHQQKGVVSVGPTMEKLTMFKTATPSIRTVSQTGDDQPAVEPFAHPFAQYHPNLAKELAEDVNAPLPEPRPFLARVDPMPPISWDGDTVGRDSFLSLGSNHGVSSGLAMTPKLTSSEPHHWESAVVMNFDHGADEPRGRSPANDTDDSAPRRKSGNNPFFGASPRMSVHSTRSSRSFSRSRSQSRSRTPSISGAVRAPLPDPDTMPAPHSGWTREEKGKFRATTPPSPTASSRAPSTIMAHDPFTDPADRESAFVLPPPSIIHTPSAHYSQGSEAQDRAMASLLAALGPAASAEEVQDRLRVASMNPSIVSEQSVYTETDGETLHQSWPVPPSRP